MWPEESAQYQRDRPEQVGVGCWRMWAEARPQGEYWYLGNRNLVPIDRMGRAAEVRVSEDEAGSYWGWLGTGENVPTGIWPNQRCFQLFAREDWAEAEALGRGRRLRLRVERWIPGPETTGRPRSL